MRMTLARSAPGTTCVASRAMAARIVSSGPPAATARLTASIACRGGGELGSVSAVIVLGPVISLSRVSTTPRDHKPLHTDPERQALVRGPAYVYTPGEGGAK